MFWNFKKTAVFFVFVFFALLFTGFFVDDKKVFLASLPDSQPQKLVFENAGKEPEAEQAPAVLSEIEKQNLIDDLKEKIDLINRQIEDLKIIEADAEEKEPEAEENEPEIEIVQNLPNPKKTTKASYAAGGGHANYLKILISEAQTAGEAGGRQEFVELFNPNSRPIDLTGWYLQKKTASADGWSTYASKSLFEGRIIGSNDYFVVSRTGYFEGSNDVFTDNSLAENNFLAFKNPNGEISDSVFLPDLEIGLAWCYDFAICSPTPKSKNIKYIPPKNILINEIQVNGLDDKKEEFVELYNPNNFEINLDGYYLQRKTMAGASYSSYAPKDLFYGQKIGSNDYFLIAREDSSFSKILGAVATDYSLGSDGGTIVLRKQGTSEPIDIVVFSNPPVGQSVGRNETSDFVIFENPTPKKKNY